MRLLMALVTSVVTFLCFYIRHPCVPYLASIYFGVVTYIESTRFNELIIRNTALTSLVDVNRESLKSDITKLNKNIIILSTKLNHLVKLQHGTTKKDKSRSKDENHI